MSFADIVAADRRLVILAMLAEDADYSHNEYVISAGLKAFGHQVSQDKLRSELAWLAEQGLVTITNTANVHVVTLTRRGKDVASGAVTVPGVKRPEPEGI